MSLSHRRTAIVLLLSVLAIASVPTPAVEAQRPASDRVLLALYYAWFSPDSFGPGLTSASPVEPYNSDDARVITRQIEQAQQAGVDGFVVSWLGPGNRTDDNLATMIDLAEPRGFRVSVYVETDSMGGPEQVAENLSYLLERYGSRHAFLRKDGRPVLFFWRQQTFPPATWQGIRDQIDPTWGTAWIAEGDGISYLNAFDGIHLFNIAWAPDPARPLSSYAARTATAQAIHGPRIWIPTIMPGYDDLAVRGGFARDREDGEYYRSTMEAALSTRPEWAVLITSWNEWPEGTQIEPSASYGDHYLSLTAEFASRYKQ
jgi:hypothetical protein